ncbi:MAG: SDR family NAD(P)-dependent oxidoreductase [Phycisphaerales bacterium]
MSNASDRPVSIVTGAGSGIGRAIALRLAKLGPVVLVGRRGKPLRETGALIGEEERDWLAIAADISEEDDRECVIESIDARALRTHRSSHQQRRHRYLRPLGRVD